MDESVLQHIERYWLGGVREARWPLHPFAPRDCAECMIAWLEAYPISDKASMECLWWMLHEHGGYAMRHAVRMLEVAPGGAEGLMTAVDEFLRQRFAEAWQAEQVVTRCGPWTFQEDADGCRIWTYHGEPADDDDREWGGAPCSF